MSWAGMLCSTSSSLIYSLVVAHFMVDSRILQYRSWFRVRYKSKTENSNSNVFICLFLSDSEPTFVMEYVNQILIVNRTTTNECIRLNGPLLFIR